MRAQIHASWIIWTINRSVTLKTQSPSAPLESPERRGASEEHSLIPWNPNQTQGTVFLSGHFRAGVSNSSSIFRPYRYFTLEMKTVRSKFPCTDYRLAFLSYLLGSLESLRGGKLLLDRVPSILSYVSVKCCRVIWDESRAAAPKRMLTLTSRSFWTIALYYWFCLLLVWISKVCHQTGLRSVWMTGQC